VEEGDLLEGDRLIRHRQADPPTPPQDLLIHQDHLPLLPLAGEAGFPDQVHPRGHQGLQALSDLELRELVGSASFPPLGEAVGWLPLLQGKAPSRHSSQSCRGLNITERRPSGGPSSHLPPPLTDLSRVGTARSSLGWQLVPVLLEALLLDTDLVLPHTVSTIGTRGTGGTAIVTIATTTFRTTTTTMTTITTGITTTPTTMKRMSVSMVVLCTLTVNGDSANVTLATKRPGESAEWKDKLLQNLRAEG